MRRFEAFEARRRVTGLERDHCGRAAAARPQSGTSCYARSVAWWHRSFAILVIASACGPSTGDPAASGEAGEESGNATTTTATAGDGESEVDDGSLDATGSSGTTSGAAESSDDESESSSTTLEVYECECAPNELCYEPSTDSCHPGQRPETYCIETPAACEGMEPTCEGECGWEICGGPYCSGPQKSICDYITPGFVCGPGLFGPCNIFTQDCDKCVSFGYGADEYTTTLCSDMKGPPVAVGEACVVEHGNGYDNCPLGSMCVADPPSATTGICREACVGNPWNASCTDPATHCVLDGWWFAWCMPN